MVLTCKELVEMIKKGYGFKKNEELWWTHITLCKIIETYGITTIWLQFDGGKEYCVGTFQSDDKKIDVVYRRYLKCLSKTHEMEVREEIIDHRE